MVIFFNTFFVKYNTNLNLSFDIYNSGNPNVLNTVVTL